MANRIHELVVAERVGDVGWRFTCQQCQASVGLPNKLVEQWEREQRLAEEVEASLTRSTMLQVHTPVNYDIPSALNYGIPSTTTTEPRAIIRHFAAAMERKLAANDAHKGGWMRADWRDMMRSLRQEVGELYEALDAWAENMYSDESAMIAEIRDEAADVGNFAAMIAQRVGALPPTDERGR